MAAVGMMSYQSRDSFPGYPQPYAVYQPAQTRAQQAQQDVSGTLAVNPYAAYPSVAQQPSSYPPQTSRSPQSTQSAASEDGPKPSLPSISNLLGMVDGERPNQEDVARQMSQAEAQHSMHHQHPQPQQQPQAQIPQQLHHQYRPNAGTLDSRQQVAAYPQQELNSSQRTMLPPSPPPPMRSDSIGETTHSPSTVSTGSSLSAQPYYIGSSLNNIEADNQRAVVAHMVKRPSVPSQPNTSPYGTSPYANSAYSASPGGLSAGSFYSPTEPAYAVQGLYSQRPLPSNFPPTAAQSTPNLPTTNPWEHHHYISPSAQSNYPQSQDRYICQTCNKAFSRPSSLKIHSHSHTGEKPFKCPHAGCGKAFSVRSNMKRHERGCHTGNGGVMSAAHIA